MSTWNIGLIANCIKIIYKSWIGYEEIEGDFEYIEIIFQGVVKSSDFAVRLGHEGIRLYKYRRICSVKRSSTQYTNQRST